MYSWRAAQYRLMILTRTGRVWCRAHGSIIYLRKIGKLARSGQGRQWIDMNFEPAVQVKYIRRQVVITPAAASQSADDGSGDQPVR